MLVTTVVDDQVHKDLHASLMSPFDEFLHVGESAKWRVDTFIV